MDELHERRVMQRLLAGDIQALTPLVRAYQQRALRAAVLITQDTALAEDVVQAAYLRVYECRASFDPARRFLPWFLRMVVNSALQTMQRQAKHTSLDAPANDITTPTGDLTFAELQVADLPDPETALEQQELIDTVAAVLAQLTPEQRAVIVLRYYVDLSEQQMSVLLAVPSGTIKSRLHTARRQLRRLLPSGLL